MELRPLLSPWLTSIRTRPVDFDLGVKYVENSLTVSSSQMKRIQDAASEHQINVGLGFSERDGHSVYIAQALIDEKGELRMLRRKMKPTHMERTIFGDASGSCLASVVELPDDGPRVGSLSCWEHIQPLLKYYTFSQNEQIHIAGWPPLDHFVEGSPGFWSMTVEGCQSQAQTYAIESQSFVLHCTSVLTEFGIELMKTKGSPIMGKPVMGSSAIIGPDGRIMSATNGPAEQLIVADLDLSLVTKNKTFADASGHCVLSISNHEGDYSWADSITDSRPDMLWLGADPTTKPVVRITTAAQ